MQFEQDILALEQQIKLLKDSPNSDQSQLDSLVKKHDKVLRKTYAKLSPWQKVQLARHPDRPKFTDYQNAILKDFVEIRGDRLFGQDSAIITGFATIGDHKIAVIGQEKGKTMEQRIKHNFGMSLPEGYRKAQRLMHLADKFALPVVNFIDTSGAFPGIESEERGQAEAIAKCMEISFNISVPMISVVIGEGGSGGAIAIGVSDYVLMLSNSIYSVISPEGCASILWKDEKYAESAANTQKLTAEDLYNIGIIDHIVEEKIGGAHRYPLDTMHSVQSAILQYLSASKSAQSTDRKINRRLKFMQIGNTFVSDSKRV